MAMREIRTIPDPVLRTPCDEITTIERLEKDLRPLWPAEVAAGKVAACVDEMVASGLLMREDSSVLMLPVARHTRSTADLRAYVLGDGVVQGVAAE